MEVKLQESFEIKRRWLSATTVSKISLFSTSTPANISPQQVTAFATSLLQLLTPTISIFETRIGDVQQLKNLRGRPAETFSNDTTALLQRQEELCFIKGVAAPLQEDDEIVDEERSEAQPFSVALNTKFENIISREILHRAVFSTTGAISSWGDRFALNSIYHLPLLEISTFRLGFEHFVPSFLGSLLGSIPTIRSRFYLSMNKDSFRLTIESDNKALSTFNAETLYSLIKQAAQSSNFVIAYAH